MRRKAIKTQKVFQKLQHECLVEVERQREEIIKNHSLLKNCFINVNKSISKHEGYKILLSEQIIE